MWNIEKNKFQAKCGFEGFKFAQKGEIYSNESQEAEESLTNKNWSHHRRQTRCIGSGWLAADGIKKWIGIPRNVIRNELSCRRRLLLHCHSNSIVRNGTGWRRKHCFSEEWNYYLKSRRVVGAGGGGGGDINTFRHCCAMHAGRGGWEIKEDESFLLRFQIGTFPSETFLLLLCYFTFVGRWVVGCLPVDVTSQ